MMAYNVLIRKTARSKRFFRSVDALSVVLAMWFLANMVLAGMSLSAQSSPPVGLHLSSINVATICWRSQRSFLVGSAALAICIWMGQLSSFMSTSARLPVKIRWSISIGLFIP